MCEIYKIMFIPFTLLLIAILYFNISVFIYNPYDDEKYIEYIEKLKLAPISSIVLDYDDILYDNIEGKNILNLIRLDSKYNYEYLIMNNDNKDCHPCGFDENENLLYLPNEIECPINYIQLSNCPHPDYIEFNYTTINITETFFLHYSNNNIDGYIYNNISLIVNESYFFVENSILDMNLTKYIYNSRLQNDSLSSLNGLLEFKAFFHLRELLISINCITLISIIAFFVLYILIVIFKQLSFLHLLNGFILAIDIILEIYYIVYIKNNTFLFDILRDYTYYKYFYKYDFNTLLLIFFSILFILYLLTISFFNLNNDENLEYQQYSSFYYTITYPFRSGKCFNLICFIISIIICHYSEFYQKLDNISDQISVGEMKRKDRKKRNDNVLRDIEEKKSELDILIEEEHELDQKIEEIKIEEMEYNPNPHDNNMIYHKLEQDIKNVEEEINQYKLDIFKEKIYDKNEDEENI